MRIDERMNAGINSEEGYTYRWANATDPFRLTELRSLGYEIVNPDGSPVEEGSEQDAIDFGRDNGGMVLVRVANEDLKAREGSEKLQKRIEASNKAALKAGDPDPKKLEQQRAKDREQGYADLPHDKEEKKAFLAEVEARQTSDGTRAQTSAERDAARAAGVSDDGRNNASKSGTVEAEPKPGTENVRSGAATTPSTGTVNNG